MRQGGDEVAGSEERIYLWLAIWERGFISTKLQYRQQGEGKRVWGREMWQGVRGRDVTFEKTITYGCYLKRETWRLLTKHKCCNTDREKRAGCEAERRWTERSEQWNYLTVNHVVWPIMWETSLPQTMLCSYSTNRGGREISVRQGGDEVVRNERKRNYLGVNHNLWLNNWERDFTPTNHVL